MPTTTTTVTLPDFEITATEERGKWIVVWHDAYLVNRHYVSPVRVRAGVEDLRAAVEVKLAVMQETVESELEE